MERRSAQALSKIEDLNTFILFDKNQSEFEAITEYDDLDVPLQVGFSWRAWTPSKQRLPAAPRQCRAAEHSPNATTQTRNERPGRTGSGHEITGSNLKLDVENLMQQRWVAVTHAVLIIRSFSLPWA